MRLAPQAVCAVRHARLAVAAAVTDATDRLNGVVQTFADALNKGDASAAAAVTTDPGQASDALGKLYESLGMNAHFEVSTVDRKDNEATLRLAATWKFGKDGRNQWTYTTTGSASQDGEQWKILWNPATVAPGLGTGPLSYSTLTPTPPRGCSTSRARGCSPSRSSRWSTWLPAPTLMPLQHCSIRSTPVFSAESLQTQLNNANGQPVTAVTLRAEDLAPIEEALSAMPNVTLAPQTRLLTSDKALTSPTLSGLSDLWQRATDDATGWAVSAETATGGQRVGGQDPKPVADIASTLDIGMQRAARNALAELTTPAAMVVIQPSTGDLLAVARTPPPTPRARIALTGLYPPGSTLKTVTVSAALQAGQVTPDSVVPCPGKRNIEGRQIPNDDNFDLVRCRCTPRSRGRATPRWVGWRFNCLPMASPRPPPNWAWESTTPQAGMTTVTGKVPVADTSALRVEEGIGQGRSPRRRFGMALVAAALARGSVRHRDRGRPTRETDRAPDRCLRTSTIK